MYYTTGFTRDEVREITARVHGELAVKRSWHGRRPALGLFDRVRLVLTFLRGNGSQYELAERFGVSQATVSRTISKLLPLIDYALRDWRPALVDLPLDRSLLVDGTLVPCWDFKADEGLFSGKRHRTGMNVQVVADLQGRFLWASTPLHGSIHDAAAIRETGLLDRRDPKLLIGDKGYIGLGMTTPYRKPADRELTESEKAVNKTINSTRAPVERTIAHLKNWKALASGYRRPTRTLPQTLQTITTLERYRASL